MERCHRISASEVPVWVDVAVEDLVRSQKTCRCEGNSSGDELVSLVQFDEPLHTAVMIKFGQFSETVCRGLASVHGRESDDGAEEEWLI
jgi:hypothetical protein